MLSEAKHLYAYLRGSSPQSATLNKKTKKSDEGNFITRVALKYNFN